MVRTERAQLLGALLVMALLGVGCRPAAPAATVPPAPTATPRRIPTPGPTEPPRLEAPSDEQVAHGQQVYARACATCHGANLQGGPGFPKLDRAGLIEGGGATASGLYRYISTQMPMTAPGSLSSGEYYAVTAFLLSRNGLLSPNVVVGPSTAAGSRCRVSRRPSARPWRRPGPSPAPCRCSGRS